MRRHTVRWVSIKHVATCIVEKRRTVISLINTIQLSVYKQMPNVVIHNIKHFPLMNSEYLVFAIVVKHVLITFNLLNTLVLKIEHFEKIIKRAQCIIICMHLDIYM